MPEFTRYAIYYAPPSGSALTRFGAEWLGWDPEAGAEVAHPAAGGLDVAALTETPRKYGFHGTLKPPFRLSADYGAFADAAAEVAGGIAPFELPALELSRLGPFLALTPSAPCPPLADMAATLVKELDLFRAPLNEAELAKRRRGGLTERQEELLGLYGYPYVMEEFRFHLTLSGRLGDEIEEVQTALAPLTAPFCAGPMPVTEVAIFGEAADGRFHIVKRLPLGG